MAIVVFCIVVTSLGSMPLALVPLDLNTCTQSESFDLPGNSTAPGYEFSWGGHTSQCYANLVGNLSDVYSFTFYLDLWQVNEPGPPPDVYGYVFDWSNPATFFLSQPVPMDQLVLANNTQFPNFVPVTATFASLLSLNERCVPVLFFLNFCFVLVSSFRLYLNPEQQPISPRPV